MNSRKSITTALLVMATILVASTALAEPGSQGNLSWDDRYEVDGRVHIVEPKYSGTMLNSNRDTHHQFCRELGLALIRMEQTWYSGVPGQNENHMDPSYGYNYGQWEVHECSYDSWHWDDCANWPSLLIAFPNGVEIIDEFDGSGINFDHWEVATGNWSQSNGRLVGTWPISSANGDVGNILINDANMPEGDFYFEAQMVVASGGASNNGHQIRLRQSFNNFYAIQIEAGNVLYGLVLYRNGSKTNIIPSTHSPLINTTPGDYNTIGIEKFGNHYKVKFNGEDLFEFDDTEFGGDYNLALGTYGNSTWERARLASGALSPGPPTLVSFDINEGAEETESQVVILNNSATGQPTYYMASENSGFTGAEWLPYSEAPEFTLSDGYETKTVYFKVKNAVGELTNPPGLVDRVDFWDVEDSDFRPSTHGFHFANWGVGSCVGMVYAAAWFFVKGDYPIPGDNDCGVECKQSCPVPESNSALYRYIRSLQNKIVFTSSFRKWLLQFQSLGTMSSELTREQFLGVRNQLAASHTPCPVMLAEPFSLLGGGHAVLVYRCEDLGYEKRLHYYDPSSPYCDDVYFTISVNGDEWTFEPLEDYRLFASLRPMDPYQDGPGYAALLCPVDIVLRDGYGREVSIDRQEISGAHYEQIDLNGDGDLDKLIVFDQMLDDVFTILAVPEDGAGSDERFDILALVAGDTVLNILQVPVSEIPSEGYLFSTLDTGSIAGVVSCEGVGLLGVPVDLYDADGAVIASVVTDEIGTYEFAGLDNGNYSVSISTPLGYQADEETRAIEVRGLPHEVNFELTELEITPQQRSRGYWAHQLHKALQNKPKDYTLDDFASFAGLINVHFNENQINPVDFYGVPQPADQADSLNVLKTLLHMGNVADEDEPMLKRLARAQLMALMLNVVSGKISQTHAISADGRTVSQAVTYCDMLVNDEIDPPDDGGPGHGSPWCRYIRASFILGFANLGITVPAGMIPEDVLQIAYKAGESSTLPEGYALYQNYPNPFNPITEISFSLPEASEAKLEIYNVMGQRVTTLIDELLLAGHHSATWDASDNASGIYFYRLTAGDATSTRKMVLLK